MAGRPGTSRAPRSASRSGGRSHTPGCPPRPPSRGAGRRRSFDREARRDRRPGSTVRPRDAEAEGMTATTAADPRTATILDAIGETPLVRIDDIWVKLEFLNPSGSVKARIATLHDRARRARGAPPPRRHDRRGIERQHGQRDEHGRGGEGLPDARGHARRDEPGAAGHQPGVRGRGPDRRRLPRDAGAREGARARRASRATSARSSSIRSGTSTRTASGSGPSCSRQLPDGVVPDAIVAGVGHRRDADRRRPGVPRRQPARAPSSASSRTSRAR